jgi:hypothetical protein
VDGRYGDNGRARGTEIIEAVLDGDAGAYAVLVRRYERPLFGS